MSKLHQTNLTLYSHGLWLSGLVEEIVQLQDKAVEFSDLAIASTGSVEVGV